MNYKFFLKLITAVINIFFLCIYAYSSSEMILFHGILLFSLFIIITILIYFIMHFDFKFILRYVDIDDMTDETKAKIRNQTKEEKKEQEKRNNFKIFLIELIYLQTYCLGILELLLIIHTAVDDIDKIVSVLNYTFPAFLALLITVSHLIKYLFKGR